MAQNGTVTEQEILLDENNRRYLANHNHWLASEARSFRMFLFLSVALCSFAAFLTHKFDERLRLHHEIQSAPMTIKATVVRLDDRGGDTGPDIHALCRWYIGMQAFSQEFPLSQDTSATTREGQEIELVCSDRDPSRCELQDQFLRPHFRWPIVVVWFVVAIPCTWHFLSFVRSRAIRRKGILTTGEVQRLSLNKSGAEASDSKTTLKIVYKFQTHGGETKYGEVETQQVQLTVSGTPVSQNHFRQLAPASCFVNVLYLPGARHLVL